MIAAGPGKAVARPVSIQTRERPDATRARPDLCGGSRCLGAGTRDDRGSRLLPDLRAHPGPACCWPRAADAIGLQVPSLAEIGGFLFVAAAFLALPATLRAAGHVRVTMLAKALPEGAAPPADDPGSRRRAGARLFRHLAFLAPDARQLELQLRLVRNDPDPALDPAGGHDAGHGDLRAGAARRTAGGGHGEHPGLRRRRTRNARSTTEGTELDLFTLSLILVAVLFFCLALGLWVGFSLMAVGLVAMALATPAPVGAVFATKAWAALNIWDLTALPMFIWMGEILFRSRLSSDMFRGLRPSRGGCRAGFSTSTSWAARSSPPSPARRPPPRRRSGGCRCRSCARGATTTAWRSARWRAPARSASSSRPRSS